MSHSYENTSAYLRQAAEKEKELLAALYSPRTCRSRHQLQQLMDKELGELVKIKMQIKKLSKEAALEGMRLDGIEYPMILWAEEIAPKLPDFMLHSLKQQAPVAAAPAVSSKAESGKSIDGKRIVIYAVTAAGVVLTITGLTMTPVNMLLLSMGIILTATGLVLLVKEVYFDKKSLEEGKPSVVPNTTSDAEAAQTADLLKKIFNQNRDVVLGWNKDLYLLVRDAIDKAKAEDTL